MEQLHERGLPVYWSLGLHIDGAGYETYPSELPYLDRVIVKVWPTNLSRVSMQRMVVLHRDFAAQEASLQQQMEREKEQGFVGSQSAKAMIEQAKWVVNQYQGERLDVRTEDLNDRIEDIVQWLSVPFEQERIA